MSIINLYSASPRKPLMQLYHKKMGWNVAQNLCRIRKNGGQNLQFFGTEFWRPLAIMQCLHVRPSVGHVCEFCQLKKNKHTFKIVSPSGSHAILVFYVPNGMAIFWREPPNGGIECRWGRQKSWLWAYIWLHCMVSTLQPARYCQHGAARSWSHKLWHLSLVVSGGACWWQRRQRNVYDKKSQHYAEGNRTGHLIACSDKSVAYVTNNKSFCSKFCTIEANYWQTRSITRPLCDSRATCLMTQCYLKNGYRVWCVCDIQTDCRWSGWFKCHCGEQISSVWYTRRGIQLGLSWCWTESLHLATLYSPWRQIRWKTEPTGRRPWQCVEVNRPFLQTSVCHPCKFCIS